MHEIYEFPDSAPNVTVKRIVLYQEIASGIYNLLFGIWDEDAQEITNDTVSNHIDRDKVLATVASTVIDFMKFHPDSTLLVKMVPIKKIEALIKESAETKTAEKIICSLS